MDSQSAILGRGIRELRENCERVKMDIVEGHSKGRISDKVKAKALQMADAKRDEAIKLKCELLVKIEMSDGVVTP